MFPNKHKRILIKYLWSEVETLKFILFTQIELCSILLYKSLKGSMNQNLISNKYFILSLLITIVFSKSLLAYLLDFP